MKQRMARNLAFSMAPIASVLVSTVVPCPVCRKLLGEHTDADLSACEGKLVKREHGASGLEILAATIRGTPYANKVPDLVKIAQLHARVRRLPCSCGKIDGEHTEDEHFACARRELGTL
jgi:hypothetical protein